MTDDLGKQRILEIVDDEESYVLNAIDAKTLNYLKTVGIIYLNY